MSFVAPVRLFMNSWGYCEKGNFDSKLTLIDTSRFLRALQDPSTIASSSISIVLLLLVAQCTYFYSLSVGPLVGLFLETGLSINMDGTKQS